MSKGAHILLAFILSAFSAVLIYLNYQQTFVNDVGDNVVVIINDGNPVPIFSGNDVVDPKSSFRHLKPHRSSRSRNAVQNQQQVDLNNPLSGGLLSSGPQGSTTARANSTPASVNSVTPIDLRRDQSAMSRNTSASYFANDFNSVTRERVMAYQQLSAFQSTASRASSHNVRIANNLSGDNQIRQSFNLNQPFDPVGPDPGGDPNPGDMIPVPNGVLYLISLLLVYFVIKMRYYYKI